MAARKGKCNCNRRGSRNPCNAYPRINDHFAFPIRPRQSSRRLLRLVTVAALLAAAFGSHSVAQDVPPEEAFQVMRPTPAGPRITPFLQYQADQAWRQDEARQRLWNSIRNE